MEMEINTTTIIEQYQNELRKVNHDLMVARAVIAKLQEEKEQKTAEKAE
ncbi:hypothetical protein MOD64_06560 [Bacillus spizizenii]|nr:hypothetical protein [Bacillus spizizenii]